MECGYMYVYDQYDIYIQMSWWHDFKKVDERNPHTHTHTHILDSHKKNIL